MILERLILDKFLTYDHLDYEFERRPLLVQGRNLTDSGQASNGSGKSGMQTGIEYCITASNSRDVRDNEIVSYGYDQSRAQLFASCDVRKERIHIDWTIKLKGSNKLSISKQKFGEDWEEVSFSNVNDGKKYILAWFAISKEDLFNYYIINNTRFKSFFKSSNKDKVDLINRFSDASIVDGIDKIDISEVQGEYDSKKESISRLNGKVELVEDQIRDEKNRDFKKELLEEKSEIEEEIEDVEDEIDDIRLKIKKLAPEKLELESDISSVEDDISDSEELIVELKKQKSHYEAELKTLNSSVVEAQAKVDDFIKTDFKSEREDFESDIKDDKKTLREAKSEKSDLEEKETKLLTFLKGLEVKLSGTITCPSCSHEFLLDRDIDEIKAKQNKGLQLHEVIEEKLDTNNDSIESIKNGISDLEKSISEINKREGVELEEYSNLSTALSNIEGQVTKLDRKIRKEQLKIDDANSDIADYRIDIKNTNLEIKDLSRQRDSLNKEIESKDKEIELLRSKIKDLKQGNSKDALKGLEFELSLFKKDIEAKEKDLQVIGDEIYKLNQWANNFKQFRMYLANQSLEAMEFHCNRYLSEMGGDLVVKFEGYRTLANGSIKDEITSKIIRNRERSFSSFSGGERGRLLFSSILANRYMINQTHPYGGLDFLSVDEVFEGIDGMGLKFLIESAKKLSVTAMIITHVTDEETSQDVLLIEKEGDTSRIVKN